MNYTLMHKTLPVVDLAIDEDDGSILKLEDVHHIEHLPVGTTNASSTTKSELSRGNLNAWWIGRSIPASRDNIQSALLNMGIRSPSALLTKSYGLSLSDQYWVCPTNANISWHDVNFFENAFSRDVGEILFGHMPTDRANINLMSPDNSSDGWLKKKWIIVDGKRLLMKAGSGTNRQEPLNEIIACAVMERLGIQHIPYRLTFQDEEPYSLCETFITTQTELVPALRVSETKKQSNQQSLLTHLLDCANTLDIPNIHPDIDKMLVLDYIIANTDRHWNNFGFVRDADTLEWHGFAPIYDSGTSLWHDDPKIGQLPKSKTFRSTHAEQIKLVKEFNWFDIGMLEGIEDECASILRQSDFIDEKRCEMIPRLIRKRAVDIERMKIKQKEQFFLPTSTLDIKSIPDPPESTEDNPYDLEP